MNEYLSMIKLSAHVIVLLIRKEMRNGSAKPMIGGMLVASVRRGMLRKFTSMMEI